MSCKLIMSEDGMDEWKPPNEAELKVIEARHERNNLISRLMGAYMLKGYRMLDRLCVECNTILLQDRSGQEYCVACKELESETSKDDPATSVEAAAASVREHRERQKHTKPQVNVKEEVTDIPEPVNRQVNTIENSPLCDPTHEAHCSDKTSLEIPNSQQQRCNVDLLDSYLKIRAKIEHFSQKLSECTSAEETLQLCNVIKACTDAAIAVKNII